MKIKIKQNILMENLNYVIRGISNKNIIPILSCLKISLKDEGLYLMSTDNELAIKTFIDKKDIESIDEIGDFVVSGRYMYDIVKKLPNDIVTIEEVIDSKIFITTNKYSFSLNCNKVSEFPNLDLEEHKNPIEINKKIFKNIISQTVFATSNQESRPVLTGLNMKIEDDLLECTATDSYRLSKKNIKLTANLEEKVNIIIPTRNLLELIKIMADDDNNLEMHIFSNKIIFKFDNIIMMSRLINGTYPDTSKLIPETYSLTMKANLNEFYKAIDGVALLTSEVDKNTIKLESNGNIVTLLSTMSEIGTAKSEIDVEKSNNTEIKIAFSAKYMMDAIKSLDCENIELLFNGEVKPIIIKNPDTNDLIQLILPIRTY